MWQASLGDQNSPGLKRYTFFDRFSLEGTRRKAAERGFFIGLRVEIIH